MSYYTQVPFWHIFKPCCQNNSHIWLIDFDQLGSVDQLNKSLLSMNSGGFESLNSCGANLQGFVAMSGDNFSDNHGRKSHPLSFLCLQDGGHDHVFQSFNPIVDHQSSSFYDPLSHLIPTMVETFGVQRDGVDSRVESFLNPDPPSFGPEFIGEIKGHGKKRKKADESVLEKPREVVHVRAKRGEATDSHSLAERMRREKINEKLRRLQDLVPGCYKTMGMSVMLDVIINYVRSLQNQIEFLSMKLSAASMFYDFNSTEMGDISTMKGTNYGQEAQMMERMMVGEGYGDFPGFQSTCPPN